MAEQLKEKEDIKEVLRQEDADAQA